MNVYTYQPQEPKASDLDTMSPEEALDYVRVNGLSMKVLRVVFEAGREYQGHQSCGCC